jgi:hypothetical protein
MDEGLRVVALPQLEHGTETADSWHFRLQYLFVSNSHGLM